MSTLKLRDVRVRAGKLHLHLNAEFSSAVTGIFGPSGSGKTTILEAIAGLRRLQSGSIESADTILADTGKGIHIRAENRRIGYVPQDLALFPHLTVRQNLLFGSRDPDRSLTVMAHLLEVLELSPFLERSIPGLSGGEKQRVAFARAVLAQPRLLLLDEPLSSLDFALREKMIRYLLRLRDEFRIPMVYVSHNPDELDQLCTEIAVLENGVFTQRGAPGEIFQRVNVQRCVYRPENG